jgi:peptidyl-prolyl cis-trans isomerase SurA
MKKLVFVLALLCVAAWSQAQNQVVSSPDPELFRVGSTSVSVSEFKYIYSKTNGEKADYSRKSVEEYLDLYIKFKRKVSRAKSMQLDTITALKQELEGYRQQLANTYLVDKEVTETLIKEAYDRMQYDVDFSHIMLKLDRNALPKDTLEAYNKMKAIAARLKKGEDFVSVAREVSEDPSVKNNDGRLGFMTALFPSGFYNLETAVYTTAVSGVSGIVRTDLGYHIVRVNSKRAARGETEVAHILIRKEQGNITSRLKIDSLYRIVLAGAEFGRTAQQNSQDAATAAQGGSVGSFGIGKYEITFEDAAFGLAKDGDVSLPIETSVGWHILKRLGRKPADSYEIAKRKLKGRIQRDSRYEISNQSMINRIKTEGKFSETAGALDKFAKDQTADFTTYKWHAPDAKSTEALFAFANGKSYSVGDFTDYLNNNSRKRLSFPENQDVTEAVKILYCDFVGETCLRHEEKQLDTKYPDFKALMREYEEGILLFEATKRIVWDKASSDTLGLTAFHDKNKDRYKWDTRAVVSNYAVKEAGKDKLADIQKYIKKKGYEKVLSKFNEKDKEIVQVRTQTIEKGKNKAMDALPVWEVKALTATEVNARDNSMNFMKIEKILPPSLKTLAESRGYVVADYQEFLEKEWLTELEKAYPLQLNKNIVDRIIKE